MKLIEKVGIVFVAGAIIVAINYLLGTHPVDLFYKEISFGQAFVGAAVWFFAWTSPLE